MTKDYISEKDLTLLSLNGSTETKTGEYIIQANFGEIVENSPEVASRVQVPGSAGFKQVAVPTLIVFLKKEHATSYTIGSKWKLRIDHTGNIRIDKE